MVTISFKVKDNHDLLKQVNEFVGQNEVQIKGPEQPIENKEQIPSSPASNSKSDAPEPAPTVSDSAKDDDKAPAVTPKKEQGSTPILTDEGLDTEGVPWDERIHSATKSKVKDGTWKKKRGVEKEEYNKIKEELKAIVPDCLKDDPQPPATPQAPTPPSATAPPVSLPDQPSEQTSFPKQEVETPKKTYDAIPQPTEDTGKPTHTLDTFKQNFVPVMALLKKQGHFNNEYLEQLKSHFEVTELWEITKDEEKVSELFNSFVEYGFITKVDQ